MMWRSNKQHTFLKMALQGSGAVENGGRIWLAWISGGVTDEVDICIGIYRISYICKLVK